MTIDPATERPVADPDGVTAPWWEATREGRLVLQRCGSCGRAQHYPRALCASCSSTDLSYGESAGHGVVYSYTVVHRPPAPAFTAPYVVALVDLDDGVRLLTNVRGCEVGDVRCGMRVHLAWEALQDGRKLPMFEPRGA